MLKIGPRTLVPPATKLVDDLQINLVGRKHVGREIYSQLLASLQEGRLEPAGASLRRVSWREG